MPGSRTAVNISGINAEQIQRGDVIAHPNQYQPTRRLDARFRLLKDVTSSIKHGQEIKFFVGASETIGILRLLGMEELNPGEEGWIQLELRDPIVAVRGDRYILRRPSPGETLGGGVIVDHNPKGRHKRFDEKVLKSLESLLKGSPADILLEAAMTVNAATIREIAGKSRLEPADAETALKELLTNGLLILLEDGEPTPASDILAIALPHWNSLRTVTFQIIEAYHKSYPLRRGIPREELKSRLKLSPRVFNALIKKLIADNSITDNLSSIAMTGHEIKFNGQEQAKVQALMRKFEQNPFSPPSVKDCQAEVGEEVFGALTGLGTLMTVSSDVVFRKQDFDLMLERIRSSLELNGKITLAEVRDLFNTSRKYVQALLEHLDAIGVTVRDGDFRKLKK